MPQALQKCSARMVPHDQQVEVTSPGNTSEEVDLVSGFAINDFTTDAHPIAYPELNAGASRVAPWCKNRCLDSIPRGQERPRPTDQAEKEVPQPHDFDELGFTNTKPCCISVSW